MEKQKNLLLKSSAIAVMVSLAAFSAQASAQVKGDGNWHGAIALGGAFANNNSTSQNLNFSADATKIDALEKYTLYSLANYGSSKTNNVTTKTAQLFRVGGRYDITLSNQTFAFAGTELETNKPANINSRYALNGGYGYHMIQSKELTFDLFAGVGYTGKKFSSVVAPAASSVKGVELLLGEESVHVLSPTSSFKQRFVFYPGQSEIGSRATFDASLSTIVSNAWTMNVGLNVGYNSKPGTGFKSTTSLLTVGFGYKY